VEILLWLTRSRKPIFLSVCETGARQLFPLNKDRFAGACSQSNIPHRHRPAISGTPEGLLAECRASCKGRWPVRAGRRHHGQCNRDQAARRCNAGSVRRWPRPTAFAGLLRFGHPLSTPAGAWCSTGFAATRRSARDWSPAGWCKPGPESGNVWNDDVMRIRIGVADELRHCALLFGGLAVFLAEIPINPVRGRIGR